MIYSIGHANRDVEDFILLLKEYKIKYLIDVRSTPYSKMFPVYNKKSFAALLKNRGFEYVFMGDTLGGLPKDSSCYIEYLDKKNMEARKVDYSILEKKEYFKTGMERLKKAFSQGFNVAVMCSELNPEECHRSKLIGVVLLKEGIVLQHINRYGKIIDQPGVNAIINGGKNPVNLWGEIDIRSGKIKKG